MFLELKDTTLYYEEFGAGNRYILSSMQHLDPDRKGWPYDLAEEGYHVYAIQMRGYGQSAHVEEGYGESWYDVWADDVADFAAAKGIRRFLYTGASDGGGVGWHLCLRHPELLIAFVGLAAGPHSRSIGNSSPSRKYTIDAVGSKAAMEQLARYHRQRILYFSQKFADDPELKEEFLQKAEKFYDMKIQMTPEEMKIQPGITLPWLKTDEEVLEALSSIHFPVLLLVGIKDAMVPIGKTIQPIAVIENAKAVFYQEANHLLYYGRRNDVRREIAAFAAEVFSKEESQ
ncbi:alpha/beta fold hydrolase [Hominifimenecus sp. rT4P-3]|uniref:alpha/beta fold hydrolase n=1 Tax=Hominifimenecus sp. rT4P-3 TaxID=3242979 RepID=UPI003DA226C3